MRITLSTLALIALAACGRRTHPPATMRPADPGTATEPTPPAPSIPTFGTGPLRGGSTQPPGMAPRISIEVAPSGPYRVDGVSVPEAMLESHLRVVAAARGTNQASIITPASTIYSRVIGVMDIARRAGLTEVTLATQP